MKIIRNKQLLFDLLAIGLTLALFYWIKSVGFSYRFGDGNAYFYMADQFLRGLLPYRDFLIADPPLLILLLAGVKAVIGNNIILFQAVPILLESATAIILFLETRKKLPNLARFTPALYLFSFLILSTTDYLTGLHFVTLFIALAYYLRKKPYLSGFFWGLATLIKLYVIPGFLGWIIWLKLNKQTKLLQKTIISYVLTGAIFMLPFLIIAPWPVIDQIIIHQFNRPAGISKVKIFSFFIMYDLVLLIMAGTSFFVAKNLKTILPLLGWIIFYLIFKDLYYLYLGVLAFWIILSINELFIYLKKSTQNSWLASNHQQLSIIIIISILFSQIVGLRIYHQTIQPKGLFPQVEAVAEFIKQLPQKSLYGSHEVAPLVALKAGLQLFNNHADTNAQLFGSGVLDKKKISTEAAQQGVYLLTKVANIPQNPDVDIGYDGYFDQEVFEKYCQRLEIFDGPGFELFTDIAVYECSKD